MGQIFQKTGAPFGFKKFFFRMVKERGDVNLGSDKV